MTALHLTATNFDSVNKNVNLTQHDLTKLTTKLNKLVISSDATTVLNITAK